LLFLSGFFMCVPVPRFVYPVGGTHLRAASIWLLPMCSILLFNGIRKHQHHIHTMSTVEGLTGKCVAVTFLSRLP
jgi:hypothetical protein